VNGIKLKSILILVVFLLLSACSQDTVEPADISEYQFANENYEEVDILQPTQKTLYISFTGVD
jgi:Tfp pilus assembly protein PilP